MTNNKISDQNTNFFEKLQADTENQNNLNKLAFDWSGLASNAVDKARGVMDFAKEKVDLVKERADKFTNDNAHKLSIAMTKKALNAYNEAKNNKTVRDANLLTKILENLEQCHWGLKKNLEEGVVTNPQEKNLTSYLVIQLDGAIEDCKSMLRGKKMAGKDTDLFTKLQENINEANEKLSKQAISFSNPVQKVKDVYNDFNSQSRLSDCIYLYNEFLDDKKIGKLKDTKSITNMTLRLEDALRSLIRDKNEGLLKTESEKARGDLYIVNLNQAIQECKKLAGG